jgi:hypothetical protein
MTIIAASRHYDYNGQPFTFEVRQHHTPGYAFSLVECEYRSDDTTEDPLDVIALNDFRTLADALAAFAITVEDAERERRATRLRDAKLRK